MHKFGVQIALEGIKEARAKWDAARRTFNSEVDFVMSRLIFEAAQNFMSAEQVAKASGLTPKHIRRLMREHGLNPKSGKRLLAAKAAEALHENAALLGIEPHEMDLMSPLAYLPMGSELRRFLETPEEQPEEAENLVCPIPGCNCDIEYRAALAHARESGTYSGIEVPE